MKSKTQKIVIASMLAALACVATMIIKIPSPLHGYINLGDCVVLTCGWLLGPAYGFLAAGIGSGLADVFSGYITYAPATFLIKGLMAILAYELWKLLQEKLGSTPAHILSGIAAEVLMVVGYLAFESVLYGFVPSLANVPANGVQGLAGLVLGVLLVKVLEKNKLGVI